MLNGEDDKQRLVFERTVPSVRRRPSLEELEEMAYEISETECPSVVALSLSLDAGHRGLWKDTLAPALEAFIKTSAEACPAVKESQDFFGPRNWPVSPETVAWTSESAKDPIESVKCQAGYKAYVSLLKRVTQSMATVCRRVRSEAKLKPLVVPNVGECTPRAQDRLLNQSFLSPATIPKDLPEGDLGDDFNFLYNR